MKLTIQHQEMYSRGELLLRTFFGWLYIALPHGFLLFFVGLWSAVLTFAAFWVVLFTGEYPRSFYEFQVALMNWSLRMQSSMMNLVDGYPSFGLEAGADNVQLEAERPERLGRGTALLKALFGWAYVLIPHGFCLWLRLIGTQILVFLAWWAVLFTGSYPAGWHAFNVGTLRWITRVQMYLGFMTDEYPRFSGRE